MKIARELSNGIIIFVGIAVYFLVIEFLGLSHLLYLRMFNALIVFYGVNRTLKANFNEGKSDYVSNLLSAGLTAVLGVLLSVGGLLSYIYIRGGDSYIDTLSEDFLFGGKPSANQYCIGVLFEGFASAIIVVFVTMQLWRQKTSTKDS